MDATHFLFGGLVVLLGILFRIPFLNFPLDDDFAIYTYIARFRRRGLRWKKDLQVIGIPLWRMRLQDLWYRDPETGVRRIRHLQTVFHVTTSLVLYGAVWVWTGNAWAAFAAGALHAFYGTNPDLTAGSYNFEQFYIPFILLGFLFLVSEPSHWVLSGLCFGAAAILKYTTALYPVVLGGLAGIQIGGHAALPFALAVALPLGISHLVDRTLGYWDAESRRQMRTRLATTLRLTRTKSMYFSILREWRGLLRQTFPVWLAGVPGLILSLGHPAGLWTAAFTGVTVAMIFFQRGFSRYHYLPLIAWLAWGSGLALDGLLRQGGPVAGTLLALWGAATVWNGFQLRDFYRRPTHPRTLARMEKFDQYLYLPRIGKLLHRYTRQRREREGRIFVWGTFSQVYHLTGLPAADSFLHHTIGPWDHPALEGFHDAVIGGLLRHKPRYVLKTFPDLDLDTLEEITGLRYRRVKVLLARFALYRLSGWTSVAVNPLTRPWREKMQVMDRLTRHPWHAPNVMKDDLEAGRLRTAFKECRKLLRLNPDDFRGWIYLGEIYDQQDRPESAARAFETALRLEADHGHVRILLAKQCIRLNRLEDAERLMQEETRRFGPSPETEYLRGLMAQHRGDPREAALHLDRFRTRFPARSDAWQALVESFTALEDREQLKRLYVEASHIRSLADREWVQTRIATALAGLDREERPEHETLAHYWKRNPANSLLLYARASAFERAGEPDRAAELFRQVTQATRSSDPVRGSAWFRLARQAAGAQRIEYARNCLSLCPDHEGARNLLLQEVAEGTPDLSGIKKTGHPTEDPA